MSQGVKLALKCADWIQNREPGVPLPKSKYKTGKHTK